MRFLLLMIPKVYQPGTPESERAGENFAPPADAVEKMMKFNEALAKAGALVSLDGLHPLQKGACVAFAGGAPKVTDGPYIESKEVVGGFWILNLQNKDEAVAWATRCPAAAGDVIEIRPIFEMTDFPADVQKAAEKYPAVKEQVEKGGKR